MTSPLRRPRPSSADDHHLIPPQPDQQQQQRPQAQPSSSALQQKLLDIVQDVFHADATASPRGAPAHKMFHRPVDAQSAPGYTDMIKEPIDLSTIKKFIVDHNGAAVNSSPSSSALACEALAVEVYNKLNLMVSNALVYNQGKGNPFRKHAKIVAKAVDAAWAKRPEIEIGEDDKDYVPTEAADDEEDEDFAGDDDEANPDSFLSGVDGALKKSKAEIQIAARVELEDLKKEQETPLEELQARYRAMLEAAAAKKSKQQQQQSSDDDNDGEDEEDDEEGGDDDDGLSSSDTDDDDDDADSEESSSDDEP